jgi:hypothetical protein
MAVSNSVYMDAVVDFLADQNNLMTMSNVGFSDEK